jgi:uncharacterized protein DUF6572
MSIDQSNKIDAIGVEKVSGKVVLTIADHLDWVDEQAHLLALQDKLNAYLRFVESGELLKVYPDAAGRAPLISIVTRVPASSAGERFFNQVRPILKSAGIELRSELLES